jgi:trehalose 6-phosphate synthase
VACHPYDITGTADALHEALSLPTDERTALAARWRERSLARTPADWLADNLGAVNPAT